MAKQKAQKEKAAAAHTVQIAPQKATAEQRQTSNTHLSRLNGSIVQTKLTVNEPGDAYVLEAD